MRFIATADWQLGMPAAFLTEESRPRFQQARLEVVRRIGALATERDVDFVLVCGDVFDSNQLDRSVVARAFDAIGSIGVPVLLLPGNHDALDASSVYTSDAFTRHCPAHVHVLSRPGVHEVVPGMEVVAAPWFSKRPLGDLVGAVLEDLEPVPGVTRVFAGHGAVDVLDPDRDNAASIEVARLRRALDGETVHFVALGDRHSTTRVDDDIWYPGAPEVTARREVDPGNVLVVEVDGAGHGRPIVERVRLGTWRFLVIEQELTAAADVVRLDEQLSRIDAKECTAVWLRLTGTLTISDKAALDDVVERHALVFAAIQDRHRHPDLAVRPDDDDFGDLGLTGFAQSAVDDLRRQASGAGGGAEAAADALGLLYRLTGAGR